MPQKTIGQVIKIARVRSNKRVADIAKDCKVSRGSVYYFETQKFIMPKHLKPLAKSLKIPLKQLENSNGEDRRRHR